MVKEEVEMEIFIVDGNAFLACKEEVAALDFDVRFMRIWEFYLAYCEAAFETGDINLMQYTLAKPAP